MAWKKGPLPPETYGWGGVVRVGDDPKAGFWFADFKGDHVELIERSDGRGTYVPILEPNQVLMYDNSLELPS